MPGKGKKLQTLLETAYKGFAYEMLALEIDVERSCNHHQDSNLIASITKLIQLYMIAVEVLQSHSDSRYLYFNQKIQALMKKKHVVEEMHLASTGKKATKEALADVSREERGVRKNEHDIQVFLNAEQCDIKKIKEIIQKEEEKLKSFQTKLHKNLKDQEEKIKARINMRKMRSECFSPRKFDLGSSQGEQERRKMNQETFGVAEPVGRRKNLVGSQLQRKGSIQKDKTRVKI